MSRNNAEIIAKIEHLRAVKNKMQKKHDIVMEKMEIWVSTFEAIAYNGASLDLLKDLPSIKDE